MRVGSFLRNAREKRGLTLAEISHQTNIKLALLIGLENNDVSRWPKQRVYRHGHLQAYARALGLEPAAVLEWFDDEFGDPHPVAFHGRPKKPARPLPFGLVRYAVLLGVPGDRRWRGRAGPASARGQCRADPAVVPPSPADMPTVMNEEAQPLVESAPPLPLAPATDNDQSAAVSNPRSISKASSESRRARLAATSRQRNRSRCPRLFAFATFRSGRIRSE